MTDTRQNPNAIFRIPGMDASQPTAALNNAPAPVVSPMELVGPASPVREGDDPTLSDAERQDQINILNAQWNLDDTPANEAVPSREELIAQERAALEEMFAAPATETLEAPDNRVEPIPSVQASVVAEKSRPAATPRAETAPTYITGPEGAARGYQYGMRVIDMLRRPVLDQYGNGERQLN